MKNRTMLFTLAILLAFGSAAFLPATRAQDHQHDQDRHEKWSDDSDDREIDEFRQSYRLAPGTRVEVSAINGTVQVETAYGDTAEVHIIRSARNREDLQYRKVNVEHTGSSLIVKGEKQRDGWQRKWREVRQRVIMRLPRQVDLAVSGINGRVRVGEVDGPVNLNGINGSVEVAQAQGYSTISGINGSIAVTVAQLGERGIKVSGVNGGVDLRFTEDINADLDVSGINGNVYTELPNVTLHGKMNRHTFKARIGAGGTPITVSGVNGRVRLSRAGANG